MPFQKEVEMRRPRQSFATRPSPDTDESGVAVLRLRQPGRTADVPGKGEELSVGEVEPHPRIGALAVGRRVITAVEQDANRVPAILVEPDGVMNTAPHPASSRGQSEPPEELTELYRG